MSRRSSARIAVALAASALVITFVAVAAGPQEKAASPAHPEQKDKPARERPASPVRTDLRIDDYAPWDHPKMAEVNKLLESYDLKPKPLPDIPDNPPPHEGAMIDLPWVVGPTDMLLVEVLETLPGRPISGERLVRPDGMISLGFYGEVHVRGLTLPQVKVAIIKHLRRYLHDEILGLVTMEDEGSPPPDERFKLMPVPDLFDDKVNPFNELEESKPAPATPTKPRASLRPGRVRDASPRANSLAVALRPARFRRTSQAGAEKQASDPNPKPVLVPFPGQGQVKITIEVQGQNPVNLSPQPPDGARPPLTEVEMGMTWKVIDPQDCDRVFVDVTKYNSKNYYVQGLVNIPGRLPCTASETVLDAIQYAGGLLASADPDNIVLIRPGRNGGKPRVYSVNLSDIRDRGEVTTNYQIFPGDRLVVGSPHGMRKDVRLDGRNGPDRPRVVPSSSRVRTGTKRGGDRRARLQ